MYIEGPVSTGQFLRMPSDLGLAPGDLITPESPGGTAVEKRTTLIAVAVSAALLLAGCSSPVASSTPTTSKTADPLTGTVTVLAAASLTEVYGNLATQFEKLHPNVAITQSFGGSSALGIMGHVNAALELDMQIKAGVVPMPEKIVLPLGSGGTTAGLLLGFAIAGLPIEVVGARVGPRAVVNRRRVMALVRKTALFIERLTGDKLPAVDASRLRIRPL